jgi:O-antigen/teichoic acid export membrane protein
VSLSPRVLKTSILRSAALLLCSNFGSILAALATSIILARVLGPERLGIFTAVMVYPLLVAAFVQGGMRQATAYLVGRRTHPEEEIAGVVASLWIVASLLGMILCAALVWPVLARGAHALNLALAVAIVPLLLMNYFSGGYLLGKEQIGQFARLRYAPAFATLVTTALFVWFLGWGIAGAQVAQIFGSMAATVSVTILIVASIGVRLRWNFGIVKDLLGLGSVYAIALLLNELIYKMSIVLLQYKGTAEDLGQYVLASQIGLLMWSIPNAVGLVVYSRRAGSRNLRKTDRDISKVFLLTILATGASCVAVSLGSPLLIPFIYGESFAASSSLLAVLLPGVMAMCAGRMVAFDLAGQGKPWMSVYAALLALLTGLLLNLWLIPHYGAFGAAISTSVAFLVMSGCMMVGFRVTSSTLV